jgi:chromosome segregation ATPase
MSVPNDVNKEGNVSKQSVSDITSRIDERVKIIAEKQKEADANIKKTANDLHALKEKVAIIADSKKEIIELRNKIHSLEFQAEALSTRLAHHDTRWGQIFDAFWKMTLMIIAGYILYKLGLQSPPG